MRHAATGICPLRDDFTDTLLAQLPQFEGGGYDISGAYGKSRHYTDVR